MRIKMRARSARKGAHQKKKKKHAEIPVAIQLIIRRPARTRKNLPPSQAFHVARKYCEKMTTDRPERLLRNTRDEEVACEGSHNMTNENVRKALNLIVRRQESKKRQREKLLEERKKLLEKKMEEELREEEKRLELEEQQEKLAHQKKLEQKKNSARKEVPQKNSTSSRKKSSFSAVKGLFHRRQLSKKNKSK
ncbi:hypothetical protein COOONC_10777 [Cooperia oncophora]